MITAAILKAITELIEGIVGKSNYEKWHVKISWKNMSQFRYDAQIAMKHIAEIGIIEKDQIEELEDSLEVLGLNLEIEQDGQIIYVYKTLL